MTELVSEYQVGNSTIWKWIQQYKNSGSFKAADNRSAEEKELIEARKRIKHLEMENDILKWTTVNKVDTKKFNNCCFY